MLRFAICDDENEIRTALRERIRTILESLDVRAELFSYADSVTLLAEKGLEDTYYIMTKNKPVDAILNSFYRKCIAGSIRTEFEVRETELKRVDVYDLCLVISNLCENAYEASERCGRKKIRLELCNKRSYIWFRIGNAMFWVEVILKTS